MTAGRDASVFLARTGWDEAVRAPLAGDASNRRYERLRQGAEHAVLMDADPARGEDVRPFLAIARHLSALGFSAPRVLAEDVENGFLLLEDLGDDLYARVVARQPQAEMELYGAAVDVLAALHAHAPPEGLADYGPQEMGKLAALAAEWYMPGATGRAALAGLAAELAGIVTELTMPLMPARPVLVLRDYHAENLLWLPARAGVARVGLLDFQDARAGHPAYDLISLTEDARRDTTADLRAAMTARHCTLTGTESEAFGTACALLAAQRNLRILGVFARLGLRDGKP
ncbi:MAG: aminoglycoside phosphotransferase, partial [Alphaproteobacteria bacterium HGW-Alphaproteobacteria-2]